ncbi:MAG: hypothetical protein ACOCV8_06150, partial [Spirochaetota bacterium]
MSYRLFVIVFLLFLLFFSASKSIEIYSQNDDYGIIHGEELPPRERISILEVIYPDFILNEKNARILNKIISGDTDVLRT